MKRKLHIIQGIILSSMLGGGMPQAIGAEKTIQIHLLSKDFAKHGIGEEIGTMTFEDSKKGLVIKSDLKGLSAGKHGFHIHENPSCEGEEKENKYQAGMRAGGHLDPEHTGKHLGPKGQGHLGDLPVLVVNKRGEAKSSVIAPHLTVAKIEGHSIMIHEGGDNYSDDPPMGGGGARIACGVIQ